MLNMSEKEYDASALKVKLPNHKINNKKLDFYDNNNSYNGNNSSFNYYPGIGIGPYTTRGINDYNNDILMFPIYKKCESERGHVNKFHEQKVNLYKRSNPLFYIYPVNKYRQLYQK